MSPHMQSSFGNNFSYLNTVDPAKKGKESDFWTKNLVALKGQKGSKFPNYSYIQFFCVYFQQVLQF